MEKWNDCTRCDGAARDAYPTHNYWNDSVRGDSPLKSAQKWRGGLRADPVDTDQNAFKGVYNEPTCFKKVPTHYRKQGIAERVEHSKRRH